MNSNPTQTRKAVGERSSSNIPLARKNNRGSGEGNCTTPTPASLEGLPNDIKVVILEHLPEVSSLKDLVRSSTVYHAVYANHRQIILSTVLDNDLGPEALFEARSIQEAAEMLDKREATVHHVKNFLQDYKRKETNNTPLDLNVLIAMTQLHCIVDALVADYSTSTLSTHPLTGTNISSPAQISPTEKRRMYRAFYRFELIRQLFTPFSYLHSFKSRIVNSGDMHTIFLAPYRLWDIEELACIYDWLVRKYKEVLLRCKPILNDLKNKDGYGELPPELDKSQDYPINQGCECLLSFGLVDFGKVVTERRVEKQAVMVWKMLQDWQSYRFLQGALKVHRSGFWDGMEDEYEDQNERSAVFDWAAGIREFNGWDLRGLRSWGYVMWDEQRVRDWGVLEKYPQMVENTSRARLSTVEIH